MTRTPQDLDLSAAPGNITVTRHDVRYLPYRWFTRDDAGVETPRNTTGWTILAQLRAKPDDPDVLATFTILDRVDAAGTGVIKISDLTEGGYWDIQFTSPSGDPETLAGGRVTVVKDVSRV